MSILRADTERARTVDLPATARLGSLVATLRSMLKMRRFKDDLEEAFDVSLAGSQRMKVASSYLGI